MEETINQRVAKIFEDSRLRSKRKFAEMIGISETSLSSIMKEKGAEPRYGTIRDILLAMPKISVEWLITGKGSMYVQNENSSIVSEEAIPYGKYSEKEYEDILSENKRLDREINRLQGQIELLREQLGLPKKDETFKGKSA